MCEEEFKIQLEWQSIIKEYLFYSESLNVSDNTLKVRKSLINRFMKYCKMLNCKSPHEVTRKIIRQFLVSQRELGLSASYVNQMLIVIRSFFLFLVDEDYLDEDDNPTDKVRFLKKTKKVTQTFNDEEMKQIIQVSGENGNKYVSNRNKMMVMMMADCGLRVNELVNLKDSDITNDRVFIEHGKGDKQRIVYVSTVLAKQIMKYRRIRNSYFANKSVVKRNLFFLGFGGEPIKNDGVQKMLRRIENKIELREDIRFSPHTFRHYFASSQLRNGADILTISRMLGHADLNTTQIYLSSIVDEELLETAKRTSPLENLHR